MFGSHSVDDTKPEKWSTMQNSQLILVLFSNSIIAEACRMLTKKCKSPVIKKELVNALNLVLLMYKYITSCVMKKRYAFPESSDPSLELIVL